MTSATLDVGNLCVYDAKLIDLNESKTNLNNYLKQLCIEGTQLLMNEIFNLPTETVEDTVVVELPKPTTILPREKPLPKDKQPTKWEQYAKLKGIQKRKKSRMVFDSVHKEYKPRFGFNRANDETKNWIYEIKPNEDPNQDFFAKTTQAKTERKAKNELQRLRNIARSKNEKIRGISLIPNDKPNKIELSCALKAAKRSDASMSKFSDKLRDEDKKTKGLAKKGKPQVSDEGMKKIMESVLNKNKKSEGLVNYSTREPRTREVDFDNKKKKGGKPMRKNGKSSNYSSKNGQSSNFSSKNGKSSNFSSKNKTKKFKK